MSTSDHIKISAWIGVLVTILAYLFMEETLAVLSTALPAQLALMEGFKAMLIALVALGAWRWIAWQRLREEVEAREERWDFGRVRHTSPHQQRRQATSHLRLVIDESEEPSENN